MVHSLCDQGQVWWCGAHTQQLEHVGVLRQARHGGHLPVELAHQLGTVCRLGVEHLDGHRLATPRAIVHLWREGESVTDTAKAQ